MSDIASGNLFMMCKKLKSEALTELPEGFTFRFCRQDELDVWKMMHYDQEPDKHLADMTEYFEKVYEPQEEVFWKRCLFVCDRNDQPVGTCFAWKAYGQVMTIHWFKVKKEFEGLGIGRALLSKVMREIAETEFPVFLHTHPACTRAIKLYTDFGFSLLTEEQIGYRVNNLQEALPYLKQELLPEVFSSLSYCTAPEYFLQAAMSDAFSQF